MAMEKIERSYKNKILTPLVYARLSIQTALLGAVTPNLRAVTVNIDEELKILTVIFIYHGEISDELFDLASVASAEIGMLEYELDNRIERLDYPEEIPDKGVLVYLRKE
jgi:hypothetical protein